MNNTAKPLRIGLFGNGRLGRAIAERAASDVVWMVTRAAPPTEPVDAAIEVSAGAAVEVRIEWALATRTPLLIGSTGWQLPDLEARIGNRIGVLVAPNFSLGVALFGELVAALARFAAADASRDPYIVEHHHAHKLDAPSGTAKMLAETVLAHCPRKTRWSMPGGDGRLGADELCVAAVRAGSTWSSHRMGVDAPGEVLEISHTARDASPYADGALQAAAWLVGRTGVFTMRDVARDLVGPYRAPESP